MALDDDETVFTSFPQSHALSNGHLSSPEDGTFSILPRYLLQRVKNTFGAGDVKRDADRPTGSRQNSSGSITNNSTSSTRSKGVNADVDQGTISSRRPSTSTASHLNRTYAGNAKQTRIASIRDEASSTVSRRSRRLSNVGNSRRTLPPVLSRPHAEFVSQSPYLGAGSLSRSHSQALSTLPEGSAEHSPPPPPYSSSPGNPFNTIPGFPIGRDVMDDAKSMSSAAGTNTGVTQIFRRLRGEALSRDYWMADEAAVDCYDCNTAFTTWRRKHHCRVCGRIFCSRCASNIIPGARFGHEGFIRVCNICVAILSHRSKNGNHLSDSAGERLGLPAASSVANLNISLPLQSSYRAGQSQYAGSTLFPRNEYSSYNLANSLSVDDFGTLQHRARRYSDASLLRPLTPDMLDDNVSPRPTIVSLGSPMHFSPQKGTLSRKTSSTASPLVPSTTPAPFRKTTADEDRALPEAEHTSLQGEENEAEEAIEDLQYHPSTGGILLNGLGISSPATPMLPGSPLQLQSAPGTNEGSHDGSGGGVLGSSTGRPTTPSAVSFLAQPMGLPFVRSRLNSRAADQVFDLADVDDDLLANPTYFDNLLRAHEQYSNLSTDINLHKLAIGHIRRLLHQCLEQVSVPSPGAWEDVLLKLLIKIAKGPRPHVREGDSMDVRRYIKIKRVPGGTPKDSEYISGTVFTKSILNKRLPRLLTNPRVMLFDYAFEFEQGETRMSRLDSLRDSERDSLRKLTKSVIDHRPHIVLVGKSVSGLALEYLNKAGIIVARNVKPSALQAAARCTQAGVFDTYQYFPDNTRLGRCAVFRAQTLVHKLIPGGRKTLMRFEGCNKDLGATIILRGGDIDVLSKIKRIMRFMSLAAYSVRLELQFLWDEHASLASDVDLGRIREFTEEDASTDMSEDEDVGEDSTKHRMKQKETARIVNRALAPYVTRILSTSPTIVFPAPHSLERLRQDNLTIRRLRSHHRQERTVTASTANQDTEASPSGNPKGGEPEGALQTSGALTRSLSDVSLLSVKPQTRTRALKISAQLAEESQIEEAESRRNEHLLLWESRLARQQDDLTAASHQHLAVLQTIICQTTTRMCDGPKLVQRHYYREGSDQTLRQFVEATILAASQKCPAKGCERVMLSHYTTYAHGQKRMHVVVEPHLGPPGSEEDILVWSVCRGCELKTLPTTLSEEAANFSFGKYLELSFYSDYLASRALPCEHNLHSDHIRFLCWRNVALRVMVDPIEVSDVIVPPLRLRVDAWTQLRIKNEEYRAIQKSTTTYWNSVRARISNFNQDLLPIERLDSGRQALAAYEDKANADQQYFESLLDKAYEEAPISQPSALNSVRVALQAKVVQWETEFINFEQTFIPSESEKARRATSSHLRRLFSDPNSSTPASPDLRTAFSPLPSVPASPMLSATPTDDTPTGSASPESISSSIMSLVGKAVPLSPALSREGLPELSGDGLPAVDDSLPDIPTLRLTQENVAAFGRSANTATHDTRPGLGHVPSFRNLTVGKPSADEDAQTDSDSTVCAEPPRPVAFLPLPLQEESRSESEDAISQRPIKARRPRPVSSIANLVHRFEEGLAEEGSQKPTAAQQQQITSAHIGNKLPFRPIIRRGKSDYSEVRSQRTRQASDERDNVLSDGALPQTSSPARLGSTLRSPNKQGRPKSPAQMRKRPSLSTNPSTSSSSRASSNLTVPGSRTLKGALGAPLRLPDREAGSRPGSSDSTHAKLSPVRPPTLQSNTDSRQQSQRPPSLVLPKPAKRMPPLGPTPVAGNRVSTMTKHFNYLSRQAERERQKQVVLSRQRRARPLAVPKASVNVFVSSKEALKEDSDDEGSSSGADDEMDGDEEEEKDRTDANKPTKTAVTSNQRGLDLEQVDQYLRDHRASLPLSSIPQSVATQLSMSSSEGSAGTDPATVGTGTESGPSIPPSPVIGAEPASVPRYGHLSESEMSSSTGTERQMSLMKTISSLWSYRGAEFTPLELPQSKLEHFDAGSRIVVREDEPSSIIAHGLDSQLYKNLMKESQNYAVASSSEVFMPESDLGHGGNRSSNWDVLDFQTDAGTDLEEVMKKPTDRHLRLAWDDATLRYTMRVFFADQFDALRKNSGCQELFIESLARCHKWDAQGGKSGSAFLKTKDDRFIIKEISPAEMTALLDFAPKYFQYLSRAYFDNLPTVLAKVLGVFRISFKSQSSGRNKRMDVLVMENIYYNKTISDQFDLKGSLRNRMVEPSGGKDCVLLDENLIQISYDKPFYVREHTKKHLETALHNDSLFLANQKIMDYSLIVGVDKTSTELVVGIVDFLRPYTWDKRLETWVKETAYIGGGPREPTILNPRIYKNRFREAMSRYFLLVPDRWTSAEAIATGQPPPILNASAPTTKSKTAQASSILEDQEQFAGGASRAQSPTTSKRFVSMAG